MAKKEQQLQLQICNYLRIQYPKAIFFSEPSGLRVSIGQAMQLKKMRSFGKLPDMFVAYPNGKYHGLFMELKVEGTTIFKKNGEMTSSEHIRAQFDTLTKLYELGYAAVFAVGFDDAKEKIDRYFALQSFAPTKDEKTS